MHIHKKIIIATFLNLLILALTAGLHFFYIGIYVTVLKTLNIPTFSNIYVACFILLIIQIVLTTLINQRLLKTKKQIIAVNLILFTFVVFLMFLSATPALLKLQSCRAERINSFYVPSNECMTFMENSKALAVYGIWFFYLIFFTGINIAVNILLLSRKKSALFLIVGILLVAFFTMVYLPNRALNSVRKQRIEIKQLPDYRLNEIPYRNLQQIQ